MSEMELSIFCQRVSEARKLKAKRGEAARKAIEAHEAEAGDGRRQVELALEQARYESNRAQRQYDSVDPENRNIAAELERR
jgi:hypothetical protein